jgi:hypothetical protein
MKFPVLLTVLGAGAVAAGLYYAAPLQAPTPAVSACMPSGPLLYLESRDFSAILRDWNSSAEKRTWLTSANYETFTRSKLFLRLSAAYDEFAEAAGFPPDLAMLQSVAGSESGLAIYDIGDLEFLYVTRLAAARAMSTVLWNARAKYETRNAGGQAFFVRANGDGKRVVAFAAARDYLLLGTREELVAGALRLMAGEKVSAAKDEGWFEQAVHTAGAPGDPRLILNLEALVRAPHFRSYWIQRNVSELKPYWSAIADLNRTPTAFTEQRWMLRKSDSTTPAVSASPLLRLVPDEAGLYRAWADPGSARAAALIERKLLAPQSSSYASRRYAPTADPDRAAAGSEADLEVRIDEPPIEAGESRPAFQPLRDALAAASVQAMLQVESTHALRDQVFVDTACAIVLEAAAEWNADAVRAALVEAAGSLWSVTDLGVRWTARSRGAQSWQELDGLARLAVAVRGKLLVVAHSGDLAAAVLERMDRTPDAAPAVYRAGFRHTRERPNFTRMMTLLDQFRPGQNAQPAEGYPFFSGNLASLSRTLERVQSVDTLVEDKGAILHQTVTYRLQP